MMCVFVITFGKLIDQQCYTRNAYKVEDSRFIDIVRQTKDMYEKNSKWVNLAYRVSILDDITIFMSEFFMV